MFFSSKVTKIIIVSIICSMTILSGCKASNHDLDTSKSQESYSPNLINGIDWDSIEPASQNDFEFHLNDNGGVTITKYIGNEENVKIPDIINERHVTELSYHLKSTGTGSGGNYIYGVFVNNSAKNVFIPDSVTRLDEYAFYSCDSLLTVHIPNTVTSIGANAFGECHNLISINIPNGITEISEEMFYRCYKLTEVTIPRTVHTIRRGAFADCTNLIEIYIPSSVTSIEMGFIDPFYACEFLLRAKYKNKTYDYEHIDELYAAIND